MTSKDHALNIQDQTTVTHHDLRRIRLLHSATSITEIPFRERLTCTVPEALRATGLGRTKLYELIGQQSLRTFKVGRRRLIVVQSLLSLIPNHGTEPRQPA